MSVIVLEGYPISNEALVTLVNENASGKVSNSVVIKNEDCADQIVSVTIVVVPKVFAQVPLTLTVSPLTTVVEVEVNAPPLILICPPETEIFVVVVIP